MLVPVGPGVYSEQEDESRDLSPERLGGGSSCSSACGVWLQAAAELRSLRHPLC